MVRYRVWAKENRQWVIYGEFKTLDDAYRCVIKEGKDSKRVFKIDIVKIIQEPYKEVTAKQAQDILNSR